VIRVPCFNLPANELSTWCYRIAINTAISWKRNATRLKRQPPENRVALDSLSSRSTLSNEAELLYRFLDSLSEIDRAVLLMYLDDLTNEEIAESTGVSNGAIRTRISRIRDQLKTWEADDGES
jgi:RNA polymerase sigma-70 factor (ECF subfamily)